MKVILSDGAYVHVTPNRDGTGVTIANGKGRISIADGDILAVFDVVAGITAANRAKAGKQ